MKFTKVESGPYFYQEVHTTPSVTSLNAFDSSWIVKFTADNKVIFNPKYTPEEGSEKAFELLIKLMVRYNLAANWSQN